MNIKTIDSSGCDGPFIGYANCDGQVYCGVSVSSNKVLSLDVDDDTLQLCLRKRLQIHLVDNGDNSFSLSVRENK